MFFKKQKRDPNKIRHTGRKRKLVKTIIVSLSLILGKALLSSYPYQSPRFDFDSQTIHDQTIHERVINMNDRDVHSFEDNDRQVILVRSDGKPVTLPTNTGPSNFPTPRPRSGARSNPNRSTYVPKYRLVPKIDNKRLGAGDNPGGDGGGDGAAEVEDHCFVSENKQSEEFETSNYDYYSNEKKKTKNKRRKSHLDRKVEINGQIFMIERTQVEKKTVRHGVDLGLDPHLGIDRKPILDKQYKKPMAKGNKKNYELFADNLEKFIKSAKMKEGYFRKGRAGERKTFNFYDIKTDRVAIFGKDDRKFISFWKMDQQRQLNEFLYNNNIN